MVVAVPQILEYDKILFMQELLLPEEAVLMVLRAMLVE
nr:MAG TPA: hypothetical protein [Caudoviricetes sp.]